MEELSNREENILFHAFNQNWLHARHVERERLQLFYFYTIIVSGVISVIFAVVTKGLDLEGASLFIVIIPLWFLFSLSFFIYSAFLKLNAEFGHNIATIQWISEKLGLIKEMEDDKKEELKGKLNKELSVEKIPSYGFFDEAYMALPLPLPTRVHKELFTWFPIIITTFILALAVWTTIYMLLVCLSNLINLTVVSTWLIAISAAVVSGVAIFCYCYKILKKTERMTEIFLEFRKPKEVKWSTGDVVLRK